MKRVALALSALLVAGVMFAQSEKQDVSVEKNGGSSVSVVGPYSGTPVLGDIIYFNGTNWVSLAKPADGTYAVTFTSSVPSYSATSAIGNSFFAVSGPASTTKTFTFPNANATVKTGSSNDYQTSFTLENPTSAENMTIRYFKNASTITEVRCVVKGSTPSVTYNLAYGTDRSAAGTSVTTSPSACTNTTTGVTATLNNTAIPTGGYLWLTTSAQSGTVTDINVTVTYTEP